MSQTSVRVRDTERETYSRLAPPEEVSEVTHAQCAHGCGGECHAWYILIREIYEILTVPSMNKRVGFCSFLKAFMCLNTHEAITAGRCRTDEQIMEEACGKDNFTALSGKVAIITGASNGLGLENAKMLMKYGCHVIMPVRNPKKAEHALKEITEKEGVLTGKATILEVELSDLTTIKPFVNSFLALKLPLHYLILNAGIMAITEHTPSAQGHEFMFAVNNLSHVLMTELLTPVMKETALTTEVRIVTLTSCAGGMARSDGVDPTKLPCPKDEYDDFGEYCVSKALNAYHASYLQRQLGNHNIVACAVHPGVIGTGLGRESDGMHVFLYESLTLYPWRKDIQKGAATTLYCALSPKVTAEVKAGACYYYNCCPQKGEGAVERSVLKDRDLMQRAYEVQMQLVSPYM